MKENDGIYIIESEGVVRHNYLNHATINDLIIRSCPYDEIRVIKPTNITKPQIDISCKIFNELCSVELVDIPRNKTTILRGMVFVVIPDAYRFAIKISELTGISYTQKYCLNEMFQDFLNHSNTSNPSIIGIDIDGNKKTFDNHQDIYSFIYDSGYDINDEIKYSLSYYGRLEDHTDFFIDKSISITSTLTGATLGTSNNKPYTIGFTYKDDIFSIECLDEQYGTILTYSTDEYITCDTTNNNSLTANGDADNSGIYFSIFSIGEHFAIKSISENKWLSCINGNLHASCANETPDIFSIFDIQLVEIDEDNGVANYTEKLKPHLILGGIYLFSLQYDFEDDLPSKK